MEIIPDGRGADPRRGVVKDVVAEYEQDIRDVLKTIGQSRCGKLLLRTIEQKPSGGRVIRILPQKIDEHNPHYAPGHHHHVIHYEPRSYEENSAFRPKWDFRRQTRPDDVLYHELFHVLHLSNAGLQPTLENRGYLWTNRAEFSAITVTNVYRSELGRRILRAGHLQFMSLHAFDDFNTLEKYREYFKEQLDKLFGEIPEVIVPLSLVPKFIAPWNPFAVPYREFVPRRDLDLMYAGIHKPWAQSPPVTALA